MQGQLVRESLLNVVRHVINSLNFLSVKLCFFSFCSELLYLGQRKNEYIFFCLPSSRVPSPPPPVFPYILAGSFLHSLVVTGVCRGEICSVGSMREQATNTNSLHSCLFFP